MHRILWIAVILLFAICSVGAAADNVPMRAKQNRISPLKPIEKKGTAPAGTGNTQTTPQGTVSVSVVGADIRANGYTIEIRNDSSTAAGLLTVQVSKGTNDKPYSATGGGLSVQNLGAGASTQVTIDQPPGWNTGYTVFTVQVIEQVSGHGVIVGQRSFSIPPL